MSGLKASLLIGNDQIITVEGLKDVVTGAFINDAAVSVVIRQVDGDLVTPSPIGLQLIDMEDDEAFGGLITQLPEAGNYIGIIEDDLPLEYGVPYEVEISVDAGGGLIASWRVQSRARFRSATE